MAKKVIHFTQARIRNLPLPSTGRVEYYDDEVQKLMCRISSTGNKAFSIMKWRNGKSQRVSIGSFSDVTVAEARRKAQAILTAINSGIDPTAEKRKKESDVVTLGEVLEMYISSRELKPRTIKDYRYKIHHDLVEWVNMPVRKISENMVLKKQKQLSQTGKALANAVMRVLRLTLNYAAAVSIIETTPTSILSKARLWHKNKRRDRLIRSNQLQSWYEAVESLSNHKAKVYFLLLLYMGFRSTEALTMEWSHVDLKTETITLHETKNGTSHTLPIPVPLIAYINSLHELTGTSKWVFSGDNPERTMWLPKKQIVAVTNASGVEFSSHDCRRTFATIAEAVGLPLTMIKRLMNHVTTNDVTGGYIVTEEETLREAINKIADYIQARVTQKDNVISLIRRAHD